MQFYFISHFPYYTHFPQLLSISSLAFLFLISKYRLFSFTSSIFVLFNTFYYYGKMHAAKKENLLLLRSLAFFLRNIIFFNVNLLTVALRFSQIAKSWIKKNSKHYLWILDAVIFLYCRKWNEYSQNYDF